MSNSIKQFKTFPLYLAFVLLVFFAIQILANQFLHKPLFSNLLWQAYLYNYLITVAGFVSLLLFDKKNSGMLGFAFMAFSMIKFFGFFILFYPVYKENGTIETSEFFAFFSSYAISLIFETTQLIKILNK